MKDITYISTIYGFIAYLLLQGDAWDYRCAKADMQDYHHQQYARMDSREALIQELHFWLDACETKYAVKSEQPAAALAHLAKRLQQDGVLISELRPLTHFVAAVNKVCNSEVKHDSFSKHFR